MHPAFEPMIVGGFEALAAAFPDVTVKYVWVGEPRRRGDVSMGYFDEDGKYIRLNSHWLGREPSVLRAAALEPPLFHGRMTQEPEHLIAHEFGHAFEWSNPTIRPRIKEVWSAATKRPKSECFADYALTNPCEYFGELFALVRMGLADASRLREYEYVTSG